MRHNCLQRSVCLPKTMWLTQVCVGEHLGGHANEFGLSETVAQVCPSERFLAGGAAKHPPELVNMISIRSHFGSSHFGSRTSCAHCFEEKMDGCPPSLRKMEQQEG